MRIGQPPAEALQIRDFETRHLSGDERVLLAEATQVLQDLGYTITESSGPAGVLAASKHRDATEAGQVVGAIVVGVLFGAANMRWDTDQVIRVTLTTWPSAGAGLIRASTASPDVAMRISFERLIRNNKGEVRFEPLRDPGLQQQFFEKLNQSLAAQEHRL